MKDKIIVSLLSATVLTACWDDDKKSSGGSNGDGRDVIKVSAAELGNEMTHTRIQSREDALLHQVKSGYYSDNDYDVYTYRNAHYIQYDQDIPKASLDDIATSLYAVNAYIDMQAHLFGYTTEQALNSLFHDNFEQDVESPLRIAHRDIELRAGGYGGIIDDDILDIALSSPHFPSDPWQAYKVFEDFYENEPDAFLIGQQIGRNIAHHLEDSTFDEWWCQDSDYPEYCSSLSYSDQYYRIAFSHTDPTPAHISTLDRMCSYCAEYSYGRIVLPAGIYQNHLAQLTVSHELGHAFYYEPMSIRNRNRTFSAFGFMSEGTAEAFAWRFLKGWDYLASQTQDVIDYEFNSGSARQTDTGFWVDYELQALLVRYLVSGFDEEQAQERHFTYVDFIKSKSSVNGSDGNVYIDRWGHNTFHREMFDEAGFVDHKGEPLTAARFQNEILDLVNDLISEGSASSYRSYAEFKYPNPEEN